MQCIHHRDTWGYCLAKEYLAYCGDLIGIEPTLQLVGSLRYLLSYSHPRYKFFPHLWFFQPDDWTNSMGRYIVDLVNVFTLFRGHTQDS